MTPLNVLKFFASLCTYQCQARGGAGGGESGKPREFDCGVYPQGGDFDQTSYI